MLYSDVGEIPIMEEKDAEGETAKIFEEFKRKMQTPYVPNLIRGLATSPAALAIYWDLNKSLNDNATIPETLRYMIFFAISESKNAKYCALNNELTCRTLGIDGAMISALVKDLDNVSPERIRAIIKFALKVAINPQGLVAEDYQRVRDSGISDDEMIEIIQLAAIANHTNTLTDALKIPIEAELSNAYEN